MVSLHTHVHRFTFVVQHVVHLVYLSGELLAGVGEGGDPYRSVLVHLADVAFVYIRHHPYVFQSGDDEHLIVLVGTYLHLLIDILFDDET